MFEFNITFLVLSFGAIVAGLAKTAFGGFGLVAAALFASVLPAKESTGTLLLVLLLGDAIAVSSYRKDIEIKSLMRVVPSVIAGLIVGFFILQQIDDVTLRKAIGFVVVAMVVTHIGVNQIRARRPETMTHLSKPVTAVFGSLAGITSMVANSGGPIMTIYLLNMNLSVLSFLATNAWFFAAINLIKLPMSISLGLISGNSFIALLGLTPLVFIGASFGRWIVRRIDKKSFENISLFSAAAVGLNLLVR